MRTLYLHIGLPKTGTSYLQRMLVRNADALLAAGLGIGPFMDPSDGASRLLRKALRTEGLGPVMARLAASPGQDLVVSSEQLSDVLRDRRIAEAFRDAAQRYFLPRIVIFLRRQDRLAQSIFAQVVKSWYAGDIESETFYFYDHDCRLAELEAVFGIGNVIAKLYPDGDRASLFSTFLATLGLDLPPDGFHDVGQQNVSLHRRKILLLSQVPKHDPAVRNVAHVMTEVVSRSGAIADDGERFLMSPRQRHDLVARYRAGNRALVARHGICDVGDFADLPDPNRPWEPPAPIGKAEFLAVSAQALARCVGRRNRYGLRVARKLTRVLPEMGHRMFVSRRPLPRVSPPLPDMLPIPDLDAEAAGGG